MAHRCNQRHGRGRRLFLATSGQSVASDVEACARHSSCLIMLELCEETCAPSFLSAAPCRHEGPTSRHAVKADARRVRGLDDARPRPPPKSQTRGQNVAARSGDVEERPRKGSGCDGNCAAMATLVPSEHTAEWPQIFETK
ncbi:unnamed protein product [Prorocentrum cordatum]|uniref:Uncharacterized protein n=1 Tax=Prorocentrum cordatum TaxID=2364126 RepID=A0ABN9SDZ0_9DINO|nr:unnamed protein product [Polarella glacialis]